MIPLRGITILYRHIHLVLMSPGNYTFRGRERWK